MGELGTLTLRLNAVTAAFEKGMKKAGDSVEEMNKSMKLDKAKQFGMLLERAILAIAKASPEAQDALDRLDARWTDFLQNFSGGIKIGADFFGVLIDGLDKVAAKIKEQSGAMAAYVGGMTPEEYYQAQQQEAANGHLAPTMDFAPKASGGNIIDDLQNTIDAGGAIFGRAAVMDFKEHSDDIGSIMARAFGTDVYDLLHFEPGTVYGSSNPLLKQVDYRLPSQGSSYSAVDKINAMRSIKEQAPAAAASGQAFLNSPAVEALAALDAVVDGTTAAFASINSKLGDFGSVSTSLVSIFTNSGGNPAAMVGGVIATIASHATSFGKLMEAASEIMGLLGNALEPLVASLIPLIRLIGGLARLFMLYMQPEIMIFSKVLTMFVKAIAWVVNGIIDIIADVVDIVSSSAAKAIRKYEIKLDDTNQAAGDADTGLTDLARNLDDQNKAKSLNIPNGVKVALDRYNNQQLGTRATDAHEAGMGYSGVSIESVTIQGMSWEDANKQIKKEAERETYARTGTVDELLYG